MVKIYFNSVPLILLEAEPSVNEGILLASWDKEVIRSAIESLQPSDKKEVILIHPDLDMALEALKNQFQVIQAAGGMALNEHNEVLLIFRRGKWDLPKGKLDEGETIETCAIREVEEETGLKNIELSIPLLTTYHTYLENEQEILKETFWYVMKAEKQDLIPQTEEDIDECKWVHLDNVASFYENMQPSVKDVIDSYLKKGDS